MDIDSYMLAVGAFVLGFITCAMFSVSNDDV